MSLPTNAETIVTVDVIESLFPNRTWLTPYEVNKALVEATGRQTPPQMMYNYVRQNLLKTSEVEGRKRVHIDDARAFIAKRVAKNLTK